MTIEASGEAWRARVLDEWNATEVPYPRDACVHELFEEHVRRAPDAPALLFVGGKLTYAELDARAVALAAVLVAEGVGPDRLVGLCLERSPEAIVAILAILKAGGAFAPLDPAYPQDRLAFMLEDTAAPVLITRRGLLERLPRSKARVICWEDLPSLSSFGSFSSFRSFPPSPDNLAYVMYTSGSTGRPKGVAVTHRDVVRLARGSRFADFGSDHVFLHLGPLSFDATTLEVAYSLLNGSALAIVPPETPSLEELGAFLARFGVTAAWLTAGLFHQMVEAQLPSLARLRLILSGGDVLSPAHVARMLAAASAASGITVVNGYGPTESTVFTTCHPMWSAAEVESPLPIGRPIGNTRVAVVDQDLRLCPPGVEGELWIGGDGLARGYLHRPDLTAERFVPDAFWQTGGRLYRTGDLVRWRPDGALDFLGRVDQQVKLRGFRVELGEIEAALASHPEVGEAAVVVQGEGGDKRLAAFWVGRTGSEPDLRSFLAERLPPHMVPGSFVRLAALPLNTNGKVDRRALAAISPAVSRTAGAAPRTPTEEVLAAIWAEVLGLAPEDAVGIDEDFFALGGHSLVATRLVSRVATDLGVDLSLRAVFENATVAGLASLVDEARSAAGGAGGQTPPVLPVPRQPGDLLPASFAQERLWLIDRLTPGQPVYNIPIALRLRGPLDRAAIESAFNALVQRHESLRTTFVEVDGRPRQRIAPLSPTVLAVADIPSEAWRLLVEDALRPFDLQRGPLVRISVYRMGEDDAWLLLNLHHVISDGWSMDVLTRELADLYAGRPLPELPVQYADFAVWQREWLSGDVLDRQIAWWVAELAGAPVLLELPADRPRPEIPSFRGIRIPLALPVTVASGVSRVARQGGATLFMMLLAAFQSLLGRYTGRRDVLVGSPVANRTRRELEGVIGFFANTLVLRGRLDDGSFRELLARTRASALGAYAHQDLPFERLVEELRIERSLAWNPLFQVAFAFQPPPMQGLALPGLTLELEDLQGLTAKFDLFLSLWESGDGGFAGTIDAAADLFDAATLERLARCFQTLLAGIVDRPDRPLSEHPLLGPAERAQVVEAWNDTRFPYPREASIHELFEEQARRTPGAVALRFPGGEMTYAELDARAGALAGVLAEGGLGPDRLAALCLERSAEAIVAMLAVLAVGGAFVPLDPAYPAERLAFMLEDTAAPVLITRRALLDRLPRSTARVICWEDLPSSSSLPSLPSLPSFESFPENLAYVMYTSGSTGRPKGVAVTHRNVVRLVRNTNFADFGPDQVFLQLAPLSFDASTLEIWGPLLNGGTLVVYPPEAPSLAELGAFLVREGITTLWLTAGLFHQMAEARPASLSGLRQLLAGGDVLSPPHVLRVLQDAPGVTLINGYGPTESTTFACCHLMRSPMRSPAAMGATPSIVPIGRPIGNTRVAVLDRGFQAVPPGVVGELYIGGDGLARGYLNRPDLTAERFVPDPVFGDGIGGHRLYRTGDLARWTPEGVVEFLGRADQQVKIRGFRIEPGEIESALASHPEVGEAAVVVQGEGEDKRLAAFWAGRSGLEPDLRAFLAERLPAHMVPAAFVRLDALPLNPNGKVDRRALAAITAITAAPGAGHGESATAPTAPRTPMEEILAALWAELLGLAPPGTVGIDEDFFALGGHSLLATRLVSRLFSELGVDLSLRAVFECPTVARLAVRVEEALASGVKAPPLRPVRREAAGLPLSSSQEGLWLADRLAPGLPVYNVPLALRLSGELDRARLEAAVDAVVRRHEILRTTFHEADGQPVQIVAPFEPRLLPVVDLGLLPEVFREDESWRQLRREALLPFDLAAGPLLRARLFHLGQGEHVLLLATHHIVSDGWSLDVLARDLGVFYGVRGAADLPELPIQYADYAAWQRQWLSGETLESLVSWWRVELAGAPTVLEVPADRPRPAAPSYRGGLRRETLPTDLAGAVRGLARRAGATLFMTLLAAFQALLHRLTGQDDLLVGSPVANRNRPEVEGLIGFFVNTLVLRGRFSDGTSLRDAVATARRSALGAYAHQDLPFDQLAAELAVERSLAWSPLFQVMLVLQQGGFAAPEMPGVRAETVALETGTAKFDLLLEVREMPEGFGLTLEYAADLFDASTAARLLERFTVLLTAAAAEPERAVADLPVMSAAERSQVLEASNGAALDVPDLCLHDLIAAQIARTPDAVALVGDSGDGGERWTYRDLDRRAGRIAAWLRGLGVGPEVAVGVSLRQTPRLVAALLGVLRAGGCYVPLDPDYPKERLALLLEDTGAPVVITESELDREESSGAPAEPSGVLPGVLPGNLAYLIYTSGSTGRPKGVAIEHRSAVAFAVWARQVFGDEELAGVFAATSVNFDLSIFELFVPLCWGGRVILGANALALPGHPAAAEVRLVNTVPSAMTELVRMRGIPPSVRTVNLAGEPLRRSLARSIAELGTVERLLNLYGPSEDTTYSTYTEVPPGDREPTIGRPLAGSRVYLFDPHDNPAPLGVAGELCLGGAGLARGYLGRPELTAERFVPDPHGDGGRLYRTGDLARWLPDGEIEYLGRIDHQVKVRGFRIEPGEIEAALLAHPGVREAAVLALGEGVDRRLAAWVAPAALPDLKPWLAARLPDYMVPAVFAGLPALPLTPNGKVDRRALAASAPERTAAVGVAGTPPRTAAEKLLAGFWADILSLEGVVGIDDDFFALGGHSLLANRLISRVAESFGAGLTLRSVFEAPTVRTLAARIEAVSEGGIAPLRLLPVARDGDFPLSFAQERLWFLYQLAPESADYNVTAPLRLGGRLDVRALQAALARIVRRHEVLRSTYGQQGGRGVQRVAPPGPVPLPVADLGDLPPDVRESEMMRLTDVEEATPFDLRRGPVHRFRLVRLGGEDWLLLLSIHHVACDGWSIGLLLHELERLYGGGALPEPPIQYGDFAVWQRRWLQGKTEEGLLRSWLQALEGAPRRIDLPTDRPRAPRQGSRGATRPLNLPARLVARVGAVSQRLGATPFMTLFAAFETVLHRVTGQDDILVGTPAAGRTRTETEGVIGCFVNTLVLRGRNEREEGSFRELVGKVRSMALHAFVHQDFPFEKLVEGVGVERSLDSNPLFQIFFAYQNAPLGDPRLGDLTVTPVDVPSRAALFDLSLGLGELGGELLGGFQYDAGLFDATTVERWAHHFRIFLAAALEDPERPLADLPRVAEPERLQLAATAGPEPEEAAEALQARLSARQEEVSERRSALSGQKRAALAKLMKSKAARLQAADELTIPRRGAAGPARLSFGQERLWFLDRLEPGTPLYNVTIALRLEGRLDLDAFRRGLDEVVRRHEVLRTVFLEVGAEQGGGPRQMVLPPFHLELRDADLRLIPEDRRDAEVRALVECQDLMPFDLAAGPVVHGMLARLSEASRALVLTFHHIVCDGLSFNVLVRELAALYSAFSGGRPASPSPLPELPIQYADYAEWQRERFEGEGLAAQLDWWKRELAGAPTKLELPTDRPRPPIPTTRGGGTGMTFPAVLGGAVAALRQKEGATSFMLFLAAFFALLGRYTGQDDLLVGSPMADRPRPETEGLIGFFVNTLVLRGRLAGPAGFRGLLARTRESVLGAFAHQDLPFERLVDELGEGRDLSRSPLFQVSFSVQTGGDSNLVELPGLTLTPIEFGLTTAKFELSVGLEEQPSGAIAAGIQFNSDLFEPATAARLLWHYGVLLEGALADPGRGLEDLPLLTAAERRQILEEWAGVSVPFEDVRDVRVQRLFEEQAARNPEAPAVVSAQGRLSYGDLDRGAGRLAERLRGLGAGPETVVAVCLERSPEQVLAIVAVLKTGAAYLPLDPSNPAERLVYTLSDSGALAVITREALARDLAPAGIPAICLDREDEKLPLPRHGGEGWGEGERDQSDLSYVIYTSGSTGNPKGTELRHSGLSNLVAWHRRAYSLTPDDRCALLAGPGFDASVWEIWPALASGASLRVPPAEIVASPPDLWTWMAAEGITVTFLPTPLAEAVMAEPVPERLALRAILTGGDRLLRRPRPEHPFVLVNHYGPTESTVVTNAVPVGVEARAGDRPPTIGRSIDNIRVFLLDRAFRPVPVGVPGELCVAGAGLARGYRHRPDLTAAAFVPDPFGAPGDRLYRTGDLARWLPDGDVEFLGRIDHQVKIRGFRIELGEIESALVALPEVREAAVLVDPAAGGNGEKHLVAYLTPREGETLPAFHALREALSARLPPYMVPSAFVVLESRARSARGKIDRKALARIKPEPEPEGEAQAVHLTPTEEILAGIWSALLGVERIRSADDFFDLGGHSLLATRLVSRLREAFGVELPLRAAFQAPRLDALARRVEEARSDVEEMAPPIVPLSPEERGPWPPLSFAQERLWFLDRLEPGGALYNVPAALRATGALDAAALEAALNGIVRRHEALRTTFDQHEGRPFQAVAPAVYVPVPRVDLTALPEERRQDELRRVLEVEAAQPFDLFRGPLLRTLLVRADEDDWAMLLNLHHIVSDGWSVGVLTAELAALYRASLEGRPAALPPLPVQYADYAVWQRHWLRGDVLDAQTAYWRERLQGIRTVLDLPTDHPRPPVQSFRGGHRPLRLAAPLPRALRALSREGGATLFMTLLAGLQAILHRYTGQEDILVGSPVANRTRSEVEGLIGFFVNALVLRGEFSSPTPTPTPRGITFRELLGRVRTEALGAYAHQDLPFERLVDELKIERSLARNPVFQVVFTFNTPSRPLGLPGLVLAPLTTEGTSAKVDLLLGVTEPESGGSEALEGSWEYSADLFDPSTVDRLSDHLAILLHAAAEAPDRPVSELPLLTAAERGQILVQWNDTAASVADCCLHHPFEAWAARRPDAPAVIFDGRTLTYGELDARAESLARHLRRLGIGPEQFAGISLERGIDRIVAVLAVFKAGGAYVPLDPSHPRDRLAWMLEDSRARVLITESRLLGALPDHGARVVCIDRDAWETGDAGERARTGPGHLAYVIYTSGSTGRPNGVLVSHGAAVNLIRRAVEQFGVGPDSRLLQSVSFSFDASVLETWTALSSGAVLCVALQETLLSGDALAAMIRRDGITTAVLTPSVLNVIPQEDLPTLAMVSVGGESCPGELASRWAPPASTLRRLLNCYGPTETTIYTTAHICSGSYRKEPPIGRPVGGTRAYVLDFHGQSAPAGVPGALWIGGAGLARGYLNRPELTAERFAPDPFGERGERLYRTGDLARWNAGGELEFLGRIDRQVKIRGLRIELGEIEGALGSHPRLRECAVLVRDDGHGGKRLAAFAVPAPPLTAQDLREHLKGRLPDYMVPASFTFLEALPHTPTGKIDRDALLRLDPAADGSAGPSGAARVEPRDVFELELVRIWREVLGAPHVSVRDNFFEAGGHSLLAVRLMAQVRQRFGKELPLSILFQGGTVEEMAERLREGAAADNSDAGAASSLVPIQPAGTRPPLFCVHPAGGDVLCFAALARHLGTDQPFYGFQSRGLAGGGEPLARIEDMASYYVGEMRRVQPRGPYRLGGWSLGGVIAFEMARQLREQGDEVALLAILDSVPDLTAEAAGFQDDVDFLLDMAAYVESLWGKSLGLTREDLEGMASHGAHGSDTQLDLFAERLRAADFLPPGAGAEQLGRILRVYKANAAAAGRYDPRPYAGNLTLIRAADMPPLSPDTGGPLSEPDLGWSRVVQGAVEVLPVPGQHLTILAEPYVEGLARELERCLFRVDQTR
jgi:amino acid adenylation domain-containing protein